MKITLTINGQRYEVDVDPHAKLLEVLRSLGFSGVKKGCEEGTCGACTVLLDGEPIYSCLLYAAKAQGHQITTIEGLGTATDPHPIQEAFADAGAVQCGYCTPGMVLATKALLEKNPNPSEEEIKLALDGNLCRCTGYVKIIDAVKEAAKRLSSTK